MAAMLSGLGDRNGGVRKTYADAIGQLVKVCTYVYILYNYWQCLIHCMRYSNIRIRICMLSYPCSYSKCTYV